jgi:hypothetical protein
MFIAVPFINFVVLLIIFRKLWRLEQELAERRERFAHIERTLDQITSYEKAEHQRPSSIYDD